MLRRLMRRPLVLLAIPAVAVALAACGSQEIDIAKNSPDYAGALTFQQRCAGCHTLKVAGTQGSSTNVNHREYKDGPNFNQRKESLDSVLYALRNGGYSSGPMPQNIVVGKQAEEVARFVEKYSGKERSAKAK